MSKLKDYISVIRPDNDPVAVESQSPHPQDPNFVETYSEPQNRQIQDIQHAYGFDEVMRQLPAIAEGYLARDVTQPSPGSLGVPSGRQSPPSMMADEIERSRKQVLGIEPPGVDYTKRDDPQFAKNFKAQVKDEFTGTDLWKKIPMIGMAVEAREAADLYSSFKRITSDDPDTAYAHLRKKRDDEFKRIASEAAFASGTELPINAPYAEITTTKNLQAEDMKRITKYFEKIAKAEERGKGGAIAKGLSDMPTYMLNFYLTGGLNSLGSKAATHGAKKLLGRLAHTYKGRALMRLSGWTSGAIARATVGFVPDVVSGTAQRRIDVMLDPNNNESPGVSLLKGWAGVVFEAASESAGGTKFPGRLLANKTKLGKKLIPSLQNAWMKSGSGRTAQAFARKIGTKTGFNGMLNEILEERLATVLNGTFGVEDYGVEGLKPFERVVTGLQQDLENFDVELAVLAPFQMGSSAMGQAAEVYNDQQVANQKDFMERFWNAKGYRTPKQMRADYGPTGAPVDRTDAPLPGQPAEEGTVEALEQGSAQFSERSVDEMAASIEEATGTGVREETPPMPEGDASIVPPTQGFFEFPEAVKGELWTTFDFSEHPNMLYAATKKLQEMTEGMDVVIEVEGDVLKIMETSPEEEEAQPQEGEPSPETEIDDERLDSDQESPGAEQDDGAPGEQVPEGGRVPDTGTPAETEDGQPGVPEVLGDETDAGAEDVAPVSEEEPSPYLDMEYDDFEGEYLKAYRNTLIYGERGKGAYNNQLDEMARAHPEWIDQIEEALPGAARPRPEPVPGPEPTPPPIFEEPTEPEAGPETTPGPEPTPPPVFDEPGPITAPDESVASGQDIETNPTDPQKEAGNYKKGHVLVDGHDVSIENPVGSERSGTDADGETWSQTINADYGYIKGTVGYDKDHLDVFVKPGYEGGSDTVYVINQKNKDGSFDEHKVIFGAESDRDALAVYNSNYEEGWQGAGGIVTMDQAQFKAWIRDKENGPSSGAAVAPSPSVEETEGPSDAPDPADTITIETQEGRFTMTVQQARDRLDEINDQDINELDANERALQEEEAEKIGEQLDRLEQGPEPTPTETEPPSKEETTPSSDLKLKGMVKAFEGEGIDISRIRPPSGLAGDNQRYMDELSRYQNPDRETMIDILVEGGHVRDSFKQDNDEEVAHEYNEMMREDGIPFRDAEKFLEDLPMGGTFIGFDGSIWEKDADRNGNERIIVAEASDAHSDVLYGDSYYIDDVDATKEAAYRRADFPDLGPILPGMREEDTPRPSPRTDSRGPDAILARIRAYQGGEQSPTAVKLYQQLGEALHPVRLQDAEELGRMYDWLDQEIITQQEYDDFVAELRESGKIKDTIDTEKPEDVESEEQEKPDVTETEQPDAGQDETGLGGQGDAAAPEGPSTEPDEGTGEPGAPGGPSTPGPGSSGTVDTSGTEEGDGSSIGPGGRSGDVDQPTGHKPSKRSAHATKLDYVIEQIDQLDKTGPKTRYKRNVAAIKLLKQIEGEGRRATADEQAVLVQFTGWGPIPQVFDSYPDYQKPSGKTARNEKWEKEFDELIELLTEEEYAEARGSTPNAHYTDPEIARAMWTGLESLGFKGGRILEPSIGSGIFYGTIPDSLASSKRFGVELDSISARIAHQLYQSANIKHSGYQDFKTPDNFFDLHISNVPFGNYPITDPQFRRMKLLIHDYFFTKAIAKTRPGGIVAFITSKGTLDKGTKSVRKAWMKQADLLGAIRLPKTAFGKIADTQVVTDILIFQKREPGTPYNGIPFDKVQQNADGFWVNEYFATHHPEHVLGQFSTQGSMYGPDEMTVEDTGVDLPAEVARIIGEMSADPSIDFVNTKTDEMRDPDFVQMAPANLKENAYTREGKKNLMQNRGGVLYPVPVTGATKQRIFGMIEIRDATRELISRQINPSATDAEIAEARKELNKIYDSFVKKWGYLSNPTNRRQFSDDPDSSLLLSLEHWDSEEKTATKSAIFTKRTQQPSLKVTEAANPGEAIAASMSERGQIDIDYMAKLRRISKLEVLKESEGMIYRDPDSGQWEPAWLYLSGDVKDKLASAKQAAKLDPEFAKNVEALEKVQPKDVAPGDIGIRLGSTWVQPRVYEEFKNHLLGWDSRFRISFVEANSVWLVEGDSTNEMWAAGGFNTSQLLGYAMNMKQPTVWIDSKARIVDEPQTIAAREMVKRIKAEFKSWVWTDNARTDELSRTYNDTYNTQREAEYDGSYLTFPGMNIAIDLKKHQTAVVARFLATGNTLMAHVVGAGKTWAGVAMAMEGRRLGKVKKPVFVVPNHKVDDWAADWRELYPGANILTATQNDFKKENRKKLMNRIATGDWDGVIVGHSSFSRVPMSPHIQEEFFRKQIEELEAEIEAMNASRNKPKNIVKEIEKAKKRLESQLIKQAAKWNKDDGPFFDELGIDMLFVDEAHEYKNLYFHTRQTRVPGISPTVVQKTFDMHMKAEFLNETTRERGLVFATGTPVTNSMAETFTMQKYMQPSALDRVGLSKFDSWAAAFGNIVEKVEVDPSGGGFRVHSRFSEFSNLQELVGMFRTFTDVIQARDLDFPLPKIIGGKSETDQAPSNDLTKLYIQSLVARAERMQQGNVDKKEDNMLLVTGDGRAFALDPRLRVPGAKDHPYSKVNRAIKNVFDIWKETEADKALQVMWVDMSTPKKGKWSLYQEIKDKLVARGIPAEQVAFVHDANKPEQLVKLYERANKGEIRVLIASTKKMGTGANVQRRLYANHHLTPPWKPAEMEQRDGRIIRQGNMYIDREGVRIIRYVTEGTFDAYMWQTMETKQKFIQDLMAGKTTANEMDDLGDATLSYAEAKALSSANPRIMEAVQLEAEVQTLRVLESSHISSQYNNKVQLDRDIPTRIAHLEKTIERIKQDIRDTLSKITDKDGNVVSDYTIAGQHYDKSTDAAVALTEVLSGYKDTFDGMVPIGDAFGMKLFVSVEKSRNETIRKIHTETPSGRTDWNYWYPADSGVGTIAKIRNQISGLPENLKRREAELLAANRKKSELEKLVGPFPKAKELADKEALLASIHEELRATETPQQEQGPRRVINWTTYEEGEDTSGAAERDQEEEEPTPHRRSRTTSGPNIKPSMPTSAGTLPSGPGGYGPVEHSETSEEEDKPSSRRQFRNDIEEVAGLNPLDELLKIVSPAHRGDVARLGSHTIRKFIGLLHYDTVQAHEALEKARRAFNYMSKEETRKFIDNMETGSQQDTMALQKIADKMTEIMAGRREIIRALGTGHLDSYLENYFPHIWKDPNGAKGILKQIFNKKRLEGSKAFTKKRSIDSVTEGIAEGLELVHENPVDLVLLKTFEMDRYIMAQNIIKELKDRGLLKFKYVKSSPVAGYAEVDDVAFRTYLPPEVTVKEAYDKILVDQLMDMARSLGVDTKRFMNIGGKRLGYASLSEKGTEKVRTKFGAPESVLAHEIGHVIGERYGLYDSLRRVGDTYTHRFTQGERWGDTEERPTRSAIEHRKVVEKEWRDLADARAGDLGISPGYQRYLREKYEKEAVVFEAYVHAPELFRKIAPTLMDEFEEFLNSQAELRPFLDIKPSLVVHEGEGKMKIPGLTQLGSWTTPEPIARILNNYLSPGLRSNENKLIASGYSLARFTGNLLNQSQLVLSLFHGLNVWTDMMSSTFGMGIRRMTTKNQRAAGVINLLTGLTPIVPFKRIWDGERLRKAYRTNMEDIKDPKLRAMVQAVIMADGRDRLDPFYYNQQIKALTNTMGEIWKGTAAEKAVGVLKLPMNVFGATLEALAKPLMEWFVPTGKFGLFYMMAEHEMQRAADGEIDEEQLHERLISSWDSVDNRMGQLVYDNLFWNKVFKDVSMLAVRSVGWNLGSWREFAGSAFDVKTTKKRMDRGDKWLSQKMAYTIGAVTLYATLGYVIQFILTGKHPDDDRDLFFPRTGRKNPDGSPERISLPTYAKDWYAYGTQPFKTVKNKIHPQWGLLNDLRRNKDFFNTEIRSPKDPAQKQFYDVAKHIGKEFLPLSVKNAQKGQRAKPGLVKNTLVSLTGVSFAPSYINRSAAQKLMYHHSWKSDKVKTKEERERYELRKQYISKIRSGQKIDYKEARSLLGKASYDNMIRSARKSAFADTYSRLSFRAAMDVYAIATAEERKQIRTILRKKRTAAKNVTREESQYFNLLMEQGQ